MSVDWESRAKTLTDPEQSDTVKRAMMSFWLEADRHEMACGASRKAERNEIDTALDKRGLFLVAHIDGTFTVQDK